MLLIFLFSVSVNLFAQTANPIHENQPAIDGGPQTFFSIQVTPGVTIPVSESSSFFYLGGFTGLSGKFLLPDLPILFLRADLDYSFDPMRVGRLSFDAGNILSLLSLGAGIGLQIDIFPFLSLQPYITAGYTFGFFNDFSSMAGNPLTSVGLDVILPINKQFKINTGAAFTWQIGVYTGLSAYLGVDIGLGTAEQTHSPSPQEPGPKPEPLVSSPAVPPKGLSISDLAFTDIFPVLHAFYDIHPVGRVTLTNDSSQTASDILIALNIKEFMSEPKEIRPTFELKPGETKTIDLCALLSEQILSVTENTRVPANLTVSYLLNGQSQEVKRIESLRVLDRNAMTWDDNRKAAPFVTPKDTAVMTFSRNIAALVKGKVNSAVNGNLTTAMAIFQALQAYGVTYAVDPKSAYTKHSQNKLMVDYLLFPRQTLSYKAGDCDDLSILDSALLESLSVPTAFITVPGHIFIAFALAMRPDETRSRYKEVDQFIFQEEETWVPIEVTNIGEGFLKAWETGAREWREYSGKGQAGFYPLSEAWNTYEPVFFKGENVQLNLPDADTITSVFLREQTAFIGREIDPMVADLQAEILKAQGSPRSVNKLGILYAKWGLFDKAMVEFTGILAKEEYVPALVNIGNVYYAQKDFDHAEEYYGRALNTQPDNPTILLALARANHALENYGAVKKYYGKLKELDPDLAGRFAYLDLKGEEAVRAAEVGGMVGVLEWSE